MGGIPAGRESSTVARWVRPTARCFDRCTISFPLPSPTTRGSVVELDFLLVDKTQKG